MDIPIPAHGTIQAPLPHLLGYLFFDCRMPVDALPSESSVRAHSATSYVPVPKKGIIKGKCRSICPPFHFESDALFSKIFHKDLSGQTTASKPRQSQQCNSSYQQTTVYGQLSWLQNTKLKNEFPALSEFGHYSNHYFAASRSAGHIPHEAPSTRGAFPAPRSARGRSR